MARIGDAASYDVVRISAICICFSYAHCGAGRLRSLEYPYSLWIGIFVFIMLVAQVYFLTDGNFQFKMDEKRRILAAACFLIEQRPDLLASDKVPFASGCDPQGEGSNAGAVTSYMRGPSKSLVMPYEFPATRFGPSHPARFDAFVSAYKNEGKILADWIILGSEALSDKNPARDFFRGS